MLIQIQPSSDAVEVLGHERRTDVRTIGTLTRISSLARVSCLTLLTRTSACGRSAVLGLRPDQLENMLSGPREYAVHGAGCAGWQRLPAPSRASPPVAGYLAGRAG
jgi:hypothetical protein